MLRYAIVLFIASVLLAACQTDTQQNTTATPQIITSGDSCHLCGMIIKNFPGPKGQAFVKGNQQAQKFCSTLDLFSFVLQPENQTQVSQVFVHDMGATDWQNPEDEFFINAANAWYVVGHNQRGAMGHTLASFAVQQKARQFCQQNGGRVIAYDDIDLLLLGQLGRGELDGNSADNADCQ
ncbi:MAG: nitrous oxide reductase accessory protein NosL [Proteobacteria bacterium]|nr:MAG: nitrous oxide reductase accessory protein NosL [Pseudomonadota bacterium]